MISAPRCPEPDRRPELIRRTSGRGRYCAARLNASYCRPATLIVRPRAESFNARDTTSSTSSHINGDAGHVHVGPLMELRVGETRADRGGGHPVPASSPASPSVNTVTQDFAALYVLPVISRPHCSH